MTKVQRIRGGKANGAKTTRAALVVRFVAFAEIRVFALQRVEVA